MDWDELLDRFGGVARLYGENALRAFTRAHVAVIGLGGVGSWTAESLARSGIGSLTMVDLDDVCLSNANRQVHTTDSTVGQPKVEAMAKRLRAIHPDIRIHPLAAFYTESTSADLLNQPFSLVIDAIDSVRQKAHLLAQCHQRQLPVISVGGAGGRIDPTRIRTADLSQSEGDRLLMLVRKKLRSQHNFPRTGKGRFRIPCVFSDEPPRYPWEDGCVRTSRPPESSGGLTCDAGLGSVTHLTAAMGLFAAAKALDLLTPPDSLPRS